MLQKASVMACVVASVALCAGCGKTANHHVYATTPATNQIAVYREDPNSGVLTQISGSPYAAGDGPTSLVLHPSGKFLYVSNAGQNEDDISLFTIDSKTGIPTEVFPRTSVAPNGSQPTLLAMDPGGGFLYVLNNLSNNISVFSIDSTKGTLAQVTNSPFTLGLSPLSMKLTPSGKFLYVTSASGTGQLSGLILGFSVTSGVLQLLGPPTPTGGINPNAIAFDPTGAHLYVANSSSQSIAIFTIGSSGGLTPVQGSPISDNYTVPIAMTFDPSGDFLYVAHQASNNIAAYSIDSSGLPTILSTSTTTGVYSTEASPNFLVVDPNGKYLFVGNQCTSAGIQAFGVSDGTLTTLSTYGVGNTPSSIAVSSQ
jgi:6-phosphogluconolactonase